MSIPTPKVRLIIVHDRGGVKSVHNKCRLTEQLVAGLRDIARVVVHDHDRFMEHVNSTESSPDNIELFRQHRCRLIINKPLPVESQQLLLQKYKSYFTDLKIWLDENPEAVIVVNGCSFLEEFRFRASQSLGHYPDIAHHFKEFMDHFAQLFKDIPSLCVLVKGWSIFRPDDPWLNAYHHLTTHAVVVDNTEDDYLKIALTYNLSNHGDAVAC